MSQIKMLNEKDPFVFRKILLYFRRNNITYRNILDDALRLEESTNNVTERYFENLFIFDMILNFRYSP